MYVEMQKNHMYMILYICAFTFMLGTPFPRHEHNPEWSTSKVNLIQETSVDFDYARISLIKTHGTH